MLEDEISLVLVLVIQQTDDMKFKQYFQLTLVSGTVTSYDRIHKGAYITYIDETTKRSFKKHPDLCSIPDMYC